MKYPERVEEIAKGLDESNFQTAASYLRRQQLDIRYHCERIAELEAELKTAKRDAILEAVGNCEDRIARCWSSDLIKYANTIGGDNV